jgi:hypothetical protein
MSLRQKYLTNAKVISYYDKLSFDSSITNDIDNDR